MTDLNPLQICKPQTTNTKNMKKLFLAVIISLTAIISSRADVTINFGAGTMYADPAATIAAPAGALLNLLVLTNGSWGTDADIAALLTSTTNSWTPAGSLLVGQFFLNEANGAGTTFNPVTFGLTNGITAGAQLLFVGYPTLDNTATGPGLGTIGFFYRTNAAISPSDIGFLVPSDGSTVNLFALDINFGGPIATNGLAPGAANAPGSGGEHGFTTVPEPSTYALLAISAAAFGGYMVRRRKRA